MPRRRIAARTTRTQPRVRGGRRRAARADAKAAARLRELEAEVAHLRGVRKHFDGLLAEYHRLIEGIAALHGSKAARSFAHLPVGKPLPPPGRKRFRLTKAALMEMYGTLAASCREVREWTSREDICRMAGLTVAESRRAFAMCVQGFRGDDGAVKPVLASNGKVGRVGRYRKAG